MKTVVVAYNISNPYYDIEMIHGLYQLVRCPLSLILKTKVMRAKLI